MGVKNRKVLLAVEMTFEQREYIKHLARLHGLSMAEYVRMRAMSPIDREEE